MEILTQATLGRTMEITLSEIKIGNRIRKEVGDIDALADSIMEVGLLHPIVVSEKNELIAGWRRIEAYKKIGFERIPVTVVGMGDLTRAEIHENIERKDFTPTEMVAVDEWLRPQVEKEAKQRAQEGRLKGGKAPKGNKNKTESKPRPEAKRTRDVIAKYVGTSGKTLEKAKKLVALSKAKPELVEPLLSKVELGKLSLDRALDEAKRKTKVAEAEELILKLPEKMEWQILEGDFVEVCKTIKAASVNLIFTDPPYGKKFLHLFGELAKVAEILLVEGGFLVLYSGQEFLPEVFEIFRNHSLTWVWQGGVFHDSTQPTYNVVEKRITVTNRWKPILIFVKGQPKHSDIGFVDFLTGEKGEKELHPWAQSESEARYYIGKLTKPNDLVLDPMVGSGTTVRAANQLKRRAIGVEVDKDTVKIAMARSLAK